MLTGHLWDYLIVFGSGVAVSFTPCVYPVMPITASCIAGMNTSGTRWKGLVLSLFYVFGMAVTYSVMGLLAVFTGKIFGQMQNSPVVFIVVANILILFALMLFDVIVLPDFGVAVQQRVNRRNILTVMALGATSGLVVGPCTAPVLGTLLMYVGAQQNILRAVSLLFIFSYGVGFSLILVGTFRGLLAYLPKSGVWMVRVKRACGVVLLIAAEYFLVKAGEGLL